MSQTAPYVLVLYYSNYGTTKTLAYAIAQGVEDAGMTARIRTVPTVAPETTATKPAIPDEGDLYCTMDDLKDCSGLALGSPTHFGNMAAPMSIFGTIPSPYGWQAICKTSQLQYLRLPVRCTADKKRPC